MGIEIFGLIAVILMVTFYALEDSNPAFIAAFAAACLSASIYAFLISSYPFALAELVWAGIAVRRWLIVKSQKSTMSKPEIRED